MSVDSDFGSGVVHAIFVNYSRHWKTPGYLKFDLEVSIAFEARR
jgi:hypothetical protein